MLSEIDNQPEPTWLSCLADKCSITQVLNLSSRGKYCDEFSNYLSSIEILPPEDEQLGDCGIDELEIRIKNVNKLRLEYFVFSEEYEYIKLLNIYNSIQQIEINGELLRHSGIMLALTQLKIKKATVLGPTESSDAYELLAGCKNLVYYTILSTSIIDTIDNNTDSIFYSRPLEHLKALQTSVRSITSHLSTISLPLFCNLEYLSITLEEALDFELSHPKIEQLKVSAAAAAPLVVFHLSLPALRQIVTQNNACLDNGVFIELLDNSPLLESIEICYRGKLVVKKRYGNLRYLSLSIVSRQEGGRFLREDSDVFAAASIEYIAECFTNLVNLRLAGVQTVVVDKHIYGLLVNVQSLLQLEIQCSLNAGQILEFHHIEDNYFKMRIPAIQSVSEALIVQSRLSKLVLSNLMIKDNLAYSLFILEHNYSIRELVLENLPEITNNFIFLLLTSTEIRTNRDIEQEYSKSVCCFENQSGDLTHEECENYSQEDENSVCSSCSIEFFDGVIEEEVMYELEELTILRCKKVTSNIYEAVLLSGYKLWKFTTDIVISPNIIEQIKDQRPWFRFEYANNPILEAYYKQRFTNALYEVI